MRPETTPIPAGAIFLAIAMAFAGLLSSAQAQEDPRTAHWAFQSLADPPQDPPTPADPDYLLHNPIDRFVTVKARSEGLSPLGPADRRTLVRRIYFDLIGLPPTPNQVREFLADDRPGAADRVVDQLLASHHYGERWGRHWMDVVRYADTGGDNGDFPVPEARLYRDYIIDSFNADKPYDRFVAEQLAGDILAADDRSANYAANVVATGFLAISRRYGTGLYEFWHLSLEDTIDTTGQAFLGLTLRCARCHDHKFDPITVEDYYGLYGIFASTNFAFSGSEELAHSALTRMHYQPLSPWTQVQGELDAYHTRLRELRAAIIEEGKDDPMVQKMVETDNKSAELTRKIKQAQRQGHNTAELEGQLAILDFEGRAHLQKVLVGEAKDKPLRREFFKLRRPGLPPKMKAAYAVAEGGPQDVAIQKGGDPKNLGTVVPRGAIGVLGGNQLDIGKGQSGRLQLAQWITDPKSPAGALAARVMVNRIWQHHFGKGIVITSSNFGLSGQPPTHPDLLEYLAGVFIDSGWSVKAMHRLILNSRTYQRASDLDAHQAAVDPANRFYWRYERRRLDAEAIRDAMLAVGGNLDLSAGGDHPFPAMDDWLWSQHNPFRAAYKTNRRSVYLMTQRILRHPYLGLFDAPDPNVTTAVRTSSTVPLQALYMMNNPFVQVQAKGLASRLLQAQAAPDSRIELAHQLAWSRPPARSEIDASMTYLDRCRQELQEAGVSADDLEMETWTSYARIMITANEFVYVD